VKLDLKAPSVEIAELPPLAFARGTGFGGELKDALALDFSSNVSKVSSKISFGTATVAIGVMPDMPAVPQTVAALDSTLALVEGASDFAEDIRNELAEGVGTVATGLVRETLSDFLENDAFDVVQSVVGGVIEPLVGAIPVVGGAIKAVVGLVRLAFERAKDRDKEPPPPVFEAPQEQPELDKTLARGAITNGQFLDRTDLFMPPPMQQLDVAYLPSHQRFFGVRLLDDGTVQVFSHMNLSLSFDSMRSGYVPGTGTSGIDKGGSPYLHDTWILNPQTGRVYDTGDYAPTTRAVLSEQWARTCSATPTIWTVNAERLISAWMDYARQLRLFLIHSKEIREYAGPEARNALVRYISDRLLSKPGHKPLLTDADALDYLVPVKAAQRLLQMQVAAQSDPTGLILFADPIGRLQAGETQWGAFSGTDPASASYQLRENFVNSLQGWIKNPANQAALCQLNPRDVPEWNRPRVIQWQQAKCFRPPPAYTQLSALPPSPPAVPPQTQLRLGVGHPDLSGSDIDEGSSDPSLPASSTGSGVTLALLLALGVGGAMLTQR